MINSELKRQNIFGSRFSSVSFICVVASWSGVAAASLIGKAAVIGLNDSSDGEWKNGKQYVTLKDEIGGKYTGEYADGKPEGHGMLKYTNGDEYDGKWKDGKPHGDGTMKYANGDKYTGVWEDGNRHGKGIYVFKDGNVHEGKWVNDLPHGKGTLTGKNGVVKYTGNYQDGKPEGDESVNKVENLYNSGKNNFSAVEKINLAVENISVEKTQLTVEKTAVEKTTFEKAQWPVEKTHWKSGALNHVGKSESCREKSNNVGYM